MSSSPRAALFALCLAGFSFLARAEEPPPAASTCPSGTGLIVLVGQRAFSLERPERNVEQGNVKWRNAIGAFTGLLGAGAMLMFYGMYDPGAIFEAEPDVDERLKPDHLARTLAEQMVQTHETPRDLLLATTDAALVDQTLRDTQCETVDVLNTLYSVQAGKKQAQLSMLSQLFRVPRNTPRALRYVIEYRSVPVTLMPMKDPSGMAATFNVYLHAHAAEVAGEIDAAAIETAQMLARLELSAHPDEAPLTLGKSGLTLICTDCERLDLVFAQTANRAWIQPAKTPQALRSLPRHIVP